MTTTPIATMFSLVICLLLVSAIAIEDLVCMKNHTFMETSGDAVLSVFIDTDYGPECNITSPRSIQEVATALYVAQQLNRADYVPGVSLGLRIYDTCNDRIAVYKQALVSAVEMDCSAHYDLGLLVPARYGEVLEPLRSLDLLPVNTYSPPNLTLPMLDVLVDFLAGRYSQVDLLLADSRPVLDAFLRKSREAGICVKSDKGGLTEAEVQADKSVNATATTTTAEQQQQQQQLVVVALGDYEDVTTWLEKGEFANEDDDDNDDDDKKIWIIMTLDNSHVDDKMLLLNRDIHLYVISFALSAMFLHNIWRNASFYHYVISSLDVLTPSRVHYTYPGQNLIFDRHSYENDRRVFVVCDQEPRVDGSRRYLECEVSLDNQEGLQHGCPIELRMIDRRSTGYVKPGSMQVRLFGEDKAILSWFDWSLPRPSANRWRLFVVHLRDCLVQEAASQQLRHLRPYGFVVYDETRFVAIVSSDDPASKCYARPLQLSDVAMCRLGFDDNRLQNSDGPYLWFKQAMRDAAMSVLPLEDGNPASDHLVVEHFIEPESGFLFAGATIVGRNKREKTRPLATYRLLDRDEYNRGADPSERVAYSTRNGYVSICAKILPEDDDPPSIRYRLTCTQWNRRGDLRYEHKFAPPYRHLNEIAVLNIPETDGDMLVLTAQCEDASCLRAENQKIWLTRMTRRGHQILSAKLYKYLCDGRIYRADAQIIRKENGLYCASQVCYQDFSVNQNRKRTSEFAFDTRCFLLENMRHIVARQDYVPEGSYLIKPEHFVVDLGPDGELDNGNGDSDDDIPASTIVRSPHVLSVGKAILEIAKGLRELQQTSCPYSSSGANEGGGTSCVLPRFEPELRKPMSNSEVYETLKVPAKSHSTRYVVSRKIDGSLSETTAYQIDSTSARYRVVAEKEQPRLSRLCVRNYTRRCQQSCSNFKLLELETGHDQHDPDENDEAQHRVLKSQVWVAILLTISSCASFACCAILAFVVYRYFVEDILDGNPLLTCLLIGATLLMLQSALPFCLEDRAMGAEHLNSRKILVSGLGFGLAFSVMLTRALFLAFSSKGVFSTQHINGYLQCLMLLFMAGVELAIAVMYFALSDADSARVARSPFYIALLGYDIFLLCSLFASCFFVSHVQRNYREGTCFFATGIGLLVCWAVWITCFLLMGQDKRDAIVCSGIVATACLIICGVLVPRTYFMCSHYVRDKSYVHAAASAMAASRFAGPPPDHLLMDDPRFVNAPVAARQGAYLDLGINGRQPFYEYVSATGSPAAQQQQQALATGSNYYYGGGNEVVTRPTTSAAAALGALPSHLMTGTGTTTTTGTGTAVTGKNRSGGGMLSRLSFRRGRSPEPRRTPGYSNYGFRPEMRELDVAANVAAQQPQPYVVPRLYVDEPDVSRIQPEAQQQQAAARAVTAASTKKGGPFSKAGVVLSEARYALPRSLLRKKVNKNSSAAGAGAAALDPSSTTRQPIEPEVFVKEHRSIFNEPYQARRSPSPRPGSALALRDDTIEEEHETQSLRSARQQHIRTLPIVPDYLYGLEAADTITSSATTAPPPPRGNNSNAGIIVVTTTTAVSVASVAVAANSSSDLAVDENGRVGLLLSSKALVQLVLNPAVGSLTGRLGYARPLLLGNVGLLLVALFFAFGRTYTVLFLARSVQGLSSACIGVSGMSLVASQYPEEDQRSRVMGYVLGSVALGVLLGYPMGSVLYDLGGKRAPFLLVAALVAALIGIYKYYIFVRSYIVPPIVFSILKNFSVGLFQWCRSTRRNSMPSSSLGYLLGTNFFGLWAFRHGRCRTAVLAMAVVGLSALGIPRARSMAQLAVPHLGLGLGIGVADAALVPLLAALVDSRPTASYGPVYSLQQAAVCLAYSLGNIFSEDSEKSYRCVRASSSPHEREGQAGYDYSERPLTASNICKYLSSTLPLLRVQSRLRVIKRVCSRLRCCVRIRSLI
ncbi:unnamed protein product [Trichogramma brassicae]|uniref:Major facilitator superfamily (MFS) profile domain-containing protein n=1 Tax=Trichogramma brassicae TaxID=86971 RepID=A0A6H5J3N9_9HYME|nr:unnamed protein product [Trichogramma brassicae]